MLTIKRLDSDEAQILIEGAAAKAREIGVPMCIAVTDESGHLIRFLRMDGGKISSISIAIDKAATGAIARRGTHVYNQLCVPGSPTFGIHVTNDGHFSIIGGGLPVIIDGERSSISMPRAAEKPKRRLPVGSQPATTISAAAFRSR